jgi:hypothetical protein
VNIVSLPHIRSLICDSSYFAYYFDTISFHFSSLTINDTQRMSFDDRLHSIQIQKEENKRTHIIIWMHT